MRQGVSACFIQAAGESFVNLLIENCIARFIVLMVCMRAFVQ